MRLFFLIPVATGILSSYISFNSKDDISYIFGVVAGLSLVLSLILAPWEIQLLILLLVLINLRQFLVKKDSLDNQNLGNQTLNNLNFHSPTNSSPQNLVSVNNNVNNLTETTIIKPQESKPNQILKYRGVEILPHQNLSSLEVIENQELGNQKDLPSTDLKLKKKTQIKYRGVVLQVDSEN